MNKCRNCGIPIKENSEVCCDLCAKQYFEYVSDESYKDYPEFSTKIENKGSIKNKDLEV